MVIIRKACKADMKQLEQLIKRWIASQTVYPPAEENVNFDPLYNEPGSLYYCVVAEDEEKKSLVGYALCTYNYAIWIGRSVMLENIFVEESYRLRGIGTRLIADVYEHAFEMGCTQVNFFTTESDDCSGFFAKMKSKDITKKVGWRVYSISQENMIATEKYL